MGFANHHRYKEFIERCPVSDFGAALFEQPMQTISIVSCAVGIVAPRGVGLTRITSLSSTKVQSVPRFSFRVQGYTEVTALKDIKANVVGMFF